LNVALAKKNKNHKILGPLDFFRADLWKRENSISNFKPSDLLVEGDYPMADMQTNACVISFFGRF